MSVDLYQEIVNASERLIGVIQHTPLLEFHALNEIAGGRVLLKPENLQRTGSFKIRGAYNALARCEREKIANGVVAWSSGNHAQGVALAAKLHGVRAMIVMPEDAPAGKIAATRVLGAEIIFYDRYAQDREQIARQIMLEHGLLLVPSYDDVGVISGQGTIGLEIIGDPLLQGQAPDQVLVCCGGGGLTAGIATAIKQHAGQTQIYAIEPEVADDTRRSFIAGERLANAAQTRSVCDALLTPMPGELTFPINQRLLSDVLCVSDEEALAAVAFAHDQLHLVLEPGGAVALASVMSKKLATEGKTSVAVLSGGNLDIDLLARANDAYERLHA